MLKYTEQNWNFLYKNHKFLHEKHIKVVFLEE